MATATVPTASPAADVNAEAALLTCMLIRPTDYVTLISRISPADFSDPKHQAIWGAITHLLENGRHVDAVTVANVLSERQELDAVGGMETLVRLQAAVASTRHGLDYAEVLLELSERRRMDAAAIELRAALAEGRAIPDAVNQFLSSLVNNDQSRRMTLDDGITEFLALMDQGPEVSRVRSAIPELDAMINGGLRGGQMLVMGARPSMGKSACALGWAYEAARAGRRVLVVTAEMAVSELAMRLISRQARIPISVLNDASVADSMSTGEWRKFGDAVVALAELPMDFIDASPTVGEIRAQVMAEAAAGRPYDLVVVDYLQLLTPPTQRGGESRQLDVSAISRGLKLMAREMDVPVIALSQLSRSVDSRADKRPIMGDLRTSGAIEQDADVVLFLFRPEVYEPGTEPGVIELIVAKQRNGPTGAVRAVFLGEHAAVLPAARTEGPSGSPPASDDES